MKQITIKVTRKHIQNGLRGSLNKCPIAQALVEAGFKKVRVDAAVATATYAGSSYLFALTNKAAQFVDAFDNRKKVKPTTLRLPLVYVEVST